MNTARSLRTLPRLAAALVAGALLVSPALLTPAGATAPHGSRAEVILETRDTTGQPWNASLNGWWGHEGAKNDTGTRPTFLSLDVSDGHGLVNDATLAALNKKLDDGGNTDSLRVAFVPYSADGSNERPTVHRGETAGEAFKWFADLGFGSALNGTTNKNDAVDWVSTNDEYTNWWHAGRPLQGFNDKLQVLDIANGGATNPSRTPEGASILDRWPAGTKISLVFYVSDGYDSNMQQMPTVKVGPDGHALTAWLTFQTVASPTNAVRTSAGYRVLTGAGTGPGVAARPVKAPAIGSSATPTPSAGATATPAAPGSTPAAQHSDNGGITSSLPGGKPTFWVLLVLLAGGALALVTVRMRAGAGGG